MQKKVFLQRNLRGGGSGGSGYLKYLMLAAICLILLVLVTPYLIRQKNREVPKRPIPEKGSVMKELPKPPEPAPKQAEPAPSQPTGPPEALSPPEAQSQPALQRVPEPPPSAQLPAPQTAPAQPSEPAPKDLFPKKGTAAEPPVAESPKPATPVQPPVKPEQKAANPGVTAPGKTATAPQKQKPAPAEAGKKTAASSGKRMYSVQVGTFKDRSEAEIIQRNLAKKGYGVMVCTGMSSNGNATYSVMTKPVDSASKAATMLEQMRSEGRTSPTVITVPQGGGDMGSPPQAKPQPKPKGPNGQN